MTPDQAQDARIDGAVQTLTAQVLPWAHEMLGLDMADTRYVIEETLCQLQQVLVERGQCELPYLGRIERTYGDAGPGWRFTPDQYALGLLPPSSAAAQLMG
jgi:hypothetical protein